MPIPDFDTQELEILSRIRLTAILTGRGFTAVPDEPDILSALLYFTRLTIRSVTGELNRLVTVAMKYGEDGGIRASRINEEDAETGNSGGSGIKLTDYDMENVESILSSLKSSGVYRTFKPEELVRLCLNSVFGSEGFDGTIKKKFLDAVFASSMYSLRPLTVLRMLNDPVRSEIPFSDEEKKTLLGMRQEYDLFDDFRNRLYSDPGRNSRAKIILQKYGGRINERTESAKNSITFTENDLTVSGFLNGMKDSHSTISNMDFQSALLGYSMHILAWTDKTANIPFIATRLFSLTYTVDESSVQKGQKVKPEFPYQEVMEAFREYRDVYSFAAWTLDTFLTDFFRACMTVI